MLRSVASEHSRQNLNEIDKKPIPPGEEDNSEVSEKNRFASPMLLHIIAWSGIAIFLGIGFTIIVWIASVVLWSLGIL